ncbi:glycosyltransferase [Roseixanthobacter glucoisosaccharinicivorans]|uniref:glycosyltransferase n=1 Tax=Roseixanthobacter glucoisosaccharinicivorans TaxID=3119923 RepID=UPI0037299D37
MSEVQPWLLIGALDRVETGAHTALVSGWCLDLRSKTAPSEVYILKRGVRIGRTSSFFPRNDLKPLGLEQNFCGFYAEVSLSVGPTEVGDISLVNSAGEAVHLMGAPAKHFIAAARGQIEAVDGTRVTGWVYNPQPDPENPVGLLAMGTWFPIKPSRERPDVKQKGLAPRSDVGFAIDLSKQVGGYVAEALPRIELRCGGEILDSVGIDGGRLLGRLETASAHEISGWATIADQPDRAVSLEVLIDGEPFAGIRADEKRADMLRLGLSNVGGRFSFTWGSSPIDKSSFQVAVRQLETGIVLAGSPAIVTGANPHRFAFTPIELSRQPVTVILLARPRRNVADFCLRTVLENTTVPANLVVIERGAGRSSVQDRIGMSGAGGISVVYAAGESVGSLLNIAIRAAASDAVVLDGEAMVGPRWLENLMIAAAHCPTAGTVSALFNDAGAFSAPSVNKANDVPDGWDHADAARAAAQAGSPYWSNVGVGHLACLFVRRLCFDTIGGFSEDAGLESMAVGLEFCLRALRSGMQNVLDDRTYVLRRDDDKDRDKAIRLPDYPELPNLVESIARRADLSAVRFQIRRAFAAGVSRPRPRVLFVISTRSGGTPQTNRDLMGAVRHAYEPFLLVCGGNRMVLHAGLDEQIELESHTLENNVDPILHHSIEYDSIVKSWLVKYAIEIVHIRHLAWHSIGLPAAASALQIPTIFSFHDFYMVCPSIKLLDENMKPCGGVCTPTTGTCVSELWDEASVPSLKHNYVHHWRQRSMRALDPCDAFVTTTQSAADILLRAFPEIEGRLRVIPHGRTFERFGRAAVCPSSEPDAPFRILLAGGLSRAKGSALVSAAAHKLRAEGVEFHLLGKADDGLDTSVVVMHGSYEREQFIAKAEALKPNLGLLPSLWSETYCHVLTEMWAAGLPVLGYDIGAVGERIQAHSGGWLFDSADVDLLCVAIRFIRAHPDDWKDRLAEVYAWQEGEGSRLTNTAMARVYMDLYSQVRSARRIFSHEASGLRSVF